ncbi:RNA polymerase sigma factor SigM [Mycolicibacterium palauense]|uniref:RNA polymerase sigma factor SigM n=1 Tax=Mycolicibacterium palauense TaxID=2034511 RepID=UPI000BFEAA4A|nr:RNA polymerase sigma factor SigM [Mycolicibacterium palauense]
MASPPPAPRPGDRSDAALLAAHLAGDPHAFAELYGRHHQRLHRLARLHTRTAEDAADALQDAMLAAHRGAAGFRHQAAVGSWLYRIVLNACLDQLRRATEHAPLDGEPTQCDPSAQVVTAVTVRRALLSLPAEQRAAVTAVDLDGYPVAEAARLLGVPAGTVKSRCARGRARLAALLAA